VAIADTFSSKPAPKLTCSGKRLLCNFVFSHQEKRSLVIIWLVAYLVIFGLSLLSFVISFFQFPTYPLYQVAAVISIGESFSLLTL
jgi:hypothetical protein